MGKLLRRYDEGMVRKLFEDEGVFAALGQRGFHDFVVGIEEGTGLPHTRLSAEKEGRRWLLLDASIVESSVPAEFFRQRGYGMKRPVSLALLYWLREEDPTTAFTPDRPPLPLQRHPGLGVLRRAFKVIITIARGCDLDGVACVPKFFHDAAIFYRSRLFLFLDPAEEGRFESLLRDAGSLPLSAAFALLSAGAVQDNAGSAVRWNPGLQVFPISPTLTAYFHSPQYADCVQATCGRSHFSWPATPPIDDSPLRAS